MTKTDPFDTIRELDGELRGIWDLADDHLIGYGFQVDEDDITNVTLAANVWFFENHCRLGLEVIEVLSFMNWYVLVKDRLEALAKKEDPKVLSSIPKPPQQALDHIKAWDGDFNFSKLTMLFG